jgi:hypothetical protein
MPSRREFIAGALATVAVACTGKKDIGPTPHSGTSINDLKKGARQLSLLGLGAGAIGGDKRDPIQTGAPLLTFDLTVSQQIIEGGTPLVYAATDDNARALGPFRAVWTPFTAYEKTGDHSPKSPIPGVYAAQVELPKPGLYTFAAVAPGGPSQGVGVTHAYVSEHVNAAVGSKAIPVDTPVGHTEHELRTICTRNPPDPMHYISLAGALKNGKPTVAVFSTPLLCESRLCGPVTDEAMLVFQKLGKARANFVHVEEFLPGTDLKPDASRLSPGFARWGFRTEPWVIVIDKKGVIRSRSEGPATASTIAAALQPLL